jgi:hypothetical protein
MAMVTDIPYPLRMPPTPPHIQSQGQETHFHTDLLCAAEYFTGRTDVQCLHRWQKVLNPEVIKGPWTPEVDCPHHPPLSQTSPSLSARRIIPCPFEFAIRAHVSWTSFVGCLNSPGGKHDRLLAWREATSEASIFSFRHSLGSGNSIFCKKMHG